MANQSQTSCGASLGRGNESLYKWSRSHDQLGMAAMAINSNQRTNGPVNAHLRSAILTKYLFKKFALYEAPPTNQNKGLGQSQPNCRGLLVLYKHFCKNRIQISAIGPEKNSQFPLFPF